MTRIATYVFIDLETTSLPNLEYNKTRITELSMVVVKRRHILDTRPGAVPRVQHKFTMCFNPRRMIDPGSTDVSGLCNDLLEYETNFNINVFNTINGFLQCLERPVCLVAQNGHTFDFPILKNHFEKLNVCLADDIMCADSLHAFFDILEPANSTFKGSDPTETQCSSAVSTDNNSIATKTSETSNEKIKDREIIDKISKEEIKLKPDFQQMYRNNNQMADAQIKTADNTTADLLHDFDENVELQSQSVLQQRNEKTPQQNKLLLPKHHIKKSKVRRKLFWGDNPKPRKSYKLKDIYERVLRRPAIDAHRAENDCIMAMEISVAVAKQFVEWVDHNHCAFTEVKPMSLGVPLGQ